MSIYNEAFRLELTQKTNRRPTCLWIDVMAACMLVIAGAVQIVLDII